MLKHTRNLLIHSISSFQKTRRKNNLYQLKVDEYSP